MSGWWVWEYVALTLFYTDSIDISNGLNTSLTDVGPETQNKITVIVPPSYTSPLGDFVINCLFPLSSK